MPGENCPRRLRGAALSKISSDSRAEIVIRRLMQAISAGTFLEGEKLPAESELCNHLGVSLLTAREALTELRKRNIISTRRGREGGSFITATQETITHYNSQQLLLISRVALGDLSVMYETITTGCVRYACRRSTTAEVAHIQAMVQVAAPLEGVGWRRQMTECYLAIAALSNSVQLTTAHIQAQAEFVPFLALQDSCPRQRQMHTVNAQRILAAITERAEATALQFVQEGIRESTRWIFERQRELLKLFPDRQITCTPQEFTKIIHHLNQIQGHQND